MIVETIFNLLSFLSNLILKPIDDFILANIPSLASILSYLSGFLNYILSYVIWAISWIPIDSVVLFFTLDLLLLYFLWVRFSYTLGLFINWLKEFRS